MKLRIYYNAEENLYYPQYKGWFFWHNFPNMAGLDVWFKDFNNAKKYTEERIKEKQDREKRGKNRVVWWGKI